MQAIAQIFMTIVRPHRFTPAGNRRLALLTGTMAFALALPVAWAAPAKAAAQAASGAAPGEAAPSVPTPPATAAASPVGNADTPTPASDEEIAFSADQLDYDSEADIVTASGNVRMLRQGNRLRADQVVWNRTTGAVEAQGNVSATDAEGNVVYADRMNVTDTLKDGVAENMLLVLTEGGRLVAQEGEKTDGLYTLSHAVYSPCLVETSAGCPKTPSWQIKAVKVHYDPNAQKVRYDKARIEMFGLPILTLPHFAHPVGDRGGTGLLLPDFRTNGLNGLEFALPYYLKIASDRDLTVTPHVYSKVAPMLEGTYRALLGKGAYTITGYATESTRTTTGATDLDGDSKRSFRGYIEANGSYQFDENWSLTGSLRRVTDRTFLRRYDISRDDRLRSTLKAERIDADSYLSISGWVVQTLRLNDSQGAQPVALPIIDYRRRLTDPVLGGVLQLQANSLAITRTNGEDMQRAFAAAEWNLRGLTGLGQEITLTGYLRGDVYHSSDNELTDVALYRGNPGWRSRGIAALAVDMRWPFSGSFLGGTQRITPRIQVVASPRTANLSLPNEDARTFELEDSNLFALNRFSGYDRFEDSTRVTYGFEYNLDLRDFSLSSIVGQSYRIDRRETLFPDGTGLDDRLSDIVGRTTLRYKDFVSFTHRFRLDKDNLAVRRNEIDAMLGSRRTYATVSYLRLNRNSSSSLEDLSDREEVRLGARIAFARYWSIFGSTVVDLTGKKEDPLSDADGFEPVRHRIGIAYQDNCIDIGLTWRRNYQSTGDARTNNTFQLRLAFRNLGI